jgi:hypothetical protein
LPADARGPAPAETTDAVVATRHIVLQPRRLLATGGKGRPGGCRAWDPPDFYSFIGHTRSIQQALSDRTGGWPFTSWPAGSGAPAFLW